MLHNAHGHSTFQFRHELIFMRSASVCVLVCLFAIKTELDQNKNVCRRSIATQLVHVVEY